MDHTVGQSPWLKHGHSQIRLYAIHLPFGPCRFSPTFRTSQGNGIAVAAVDQYAVCTVYLYHMFFLLCSYTWLLLFNMIFKTILVWNLSSGFFLAYPGPPRFLGRTSLALRDYWRVKLGTSNRSEIGIASWAVAICSDHIWNHVSLNDRNLSPWIFQKVASSHSFSGETHGRP